jgi:hypothetical protein
MKISLLYLFACLSLGTHQVYAQVYGCTDPLANNYNSSATNNDGSCVYAQASVSAVTSVILDSALSETSGLILWNQKLLTHNDNNDTELYELDTLSGNILQQYPLPGVANYDWEDIANDSLYIYIGDFGNNVNGNRTDLHILRIEKSSLLNNSPVIDTIYFSYSDQTDFTPTGSNNTDFDCEAFIVSNDSIFLFNKQWVSNQTSLYSLPKTPGIHIAELKSVLDVQGMITGATYLESKRLIVLCAYTNLLQPFVYLLYDFEGNEFFGGNKRNLSLPLPFHQVEAIVTSDGLKYYCSNEAFAQPPVINTPQKLHTFDLTLYLENYLDELILTEQELTATNFQIFPMPINESLSIYCKTESVNGSYMITDQSGKLVDSGGIQFQKTDIDLSKLISGMYFLSIFQSGQTDTSYKIIKQ